MGWKNNPHRFARHGWQRCREVLMVGIVLKNLVWIIKGIVGRAQDWPYYWSSQTPSRDFTRTFPVKLADRNKTLISFVLTHLSESFLNLLISWEMSHTDSWDSCPSNPTTPPSLTSSLLISGTYHVSNGLKQVILRWWIDSCVLLRVWLLCFRVRWPPSAGHAESHGEEEAGLHPWAHRHGGELRQWPSARHRGEHSPWWWYLFQ